MTGKSTEDAAAKRQTTEDACVNSDASADHWNVRAVESLKVLGSGRAARAELVKTTDPEGNEQLCVEKIFSPGLLTRFIYRCCFQASFPYETSPDAILASFYRRRVASRLMRTFVPDVAIAEPLYVRWDEQSAAHVLGAEFIEGRGIRPAPANLRMLRDRLPWNRRSSETGAPEEINELLDVMWRLESMLRESGLVGSGWQVCKAAVVSTANLLKTPSGYVVVDLESGIPAMLVAHYVMAGLRIRSLPLFDDVDPAALRRFLEQHEMKLRETLGTDDFQALQSDAARLIEHSAHWKNSEVGIFRQGLPFIGREFQQLYRQRCLDHWHRTGRTDDETNQRFKMSSRLYSRLTYWAGLIPGSVGRFLQKLCGNSQYRSRSYRFISDPAFRKSEAAAFRKRKSDEFEKEGRIPSNKNFASSSIAFCLNWVMSKLLPVAAQRWLTDPQRRRNQRMRLWLLIVSERFQRQFGQLTIRSAIDSWQDDGRLHAGEHEQLQQLCDSQELDEYARCFGMHLSVKLAGPLLFPLKVGGVAAFVATGNLAYLIPMVVSPALRTLITISRMFRRGRGGTAYGEALLVGAMPTIGSLAFPVQMYSSHPELSTFLIRDGVARLSRLFPIYGGRDSRLEIFAIKAANIPLELIDAGVGITSKIRSWLPFSAAGPVAQPVSYRLSRWDALADEQLQLIREEQSREDNVDLIDSRTVAESTGKAA